MFIMKVISKQNVLLLECYCKSQKHSSVAFSTTEAEISGASETARKIFWLIRILKKIVNVQKILNYNIDKLANNSLYKYQ